MSGSGACRDNLDSWLDDAEIDAPAPQETPAQERWIKVAHILHNSAHCNLSWDTCKLLAQRIAKECIVNCDPAFQKVIEEAQAVVDCFGLGQSPEKFVEQVTGFIEDLREALRLARQGE